MKPYLGWLCLGVSISTLLTDCSNLGILRTHVLSKGGDDDPGKCKLTLNKANKVLGSPCEDMSGLQILVHGLALARQKLNLLQKTRVNQAIKDGLVYLRR